MAKTTIRIPKACTHDRYIFKDGDVRDDLPEAIARLLVAQGNAELVADEPAPEVAAEPETKPAPEVAAEHHDA